jgi:hypothetical protein
MDQSHGVIVRRSYDSCHLEGRHTVDAAGHGQAGELRALYRVDVVLQDNAGRLVVTE